MESVYYHISKDLQFSFDVGEMDRVTFLFFTEQMDCYTH